MDLATNVRQYYLENYRILPEYAQFHLASRLAAWEGNTEALRILQELRSYMLPADTKTILHTVLSLPPRRVYGFDLRKQYFNKYPDLFGLHEALFKVRHWLEIYNTDARQELLDIAGPDKMNRLYLALAKDNQALQILSRFAIDYIYLYEILFDVERRLKPENFLPLQSPPVSDDSTRSHLMIYLYTHAIIADTNFYIRQVPANRLQFYRQLLDSVKPTIMKSGDSIKLDTKLEFLVANRICGQLSELNLTINNQVENSLSPDGTFIIDKLNADKTRSLNTFSGSEHRNVLFIMSTRPYTPNAIKLG